jgi:hypothetical protein
MQKTAKPFGLTFLSEVPAAELEKINGGRRHKKHPTGGSGNQGPILTTMHMSMPQPAFPTGDSG